MFGWSWCGKIPYLQIAGTLYGITVIIKIALFFHQLYIKLFYTLESFYLLSCFRNITLKTFGSNYRKMYREPTKRRAWLVSVQA